MRRSLPPVLALAVLGCALLAGCDASATDDPDTLLLDAQLARQDGRIDDAVALLERAHALDPAHAGVRVELASAYFEVGGLDLLDLDRVARYLADPETHGDVLGDGDVQLSPDGVCVLLDDPGAEPFDLRGVAGYDALVAQRHRVQDALALLHPTDGPPLMTSALRTESVCTVAGPEGALGYARDEALATLRDAGLSDRTIASALALNASAQVFEAYFFLAEDLLALDVWFRTETGIGICSDDFDELYAHVEVALHDLFEAVASLDLRSDLVGGSEASALLVDSVTEAHALVASALPICE